jgi:SAM-dependent methyltransferase
MLVGTTNQIIRDRWVEQKLSNIPSGYRILDAGAGQLKYKTYCSHLNYVSQDFAKYDGIGNNLGLQTGHWDQSLLDIISDITNIPEPDESFDAAMCIEVLEHVPSPIKALRELIRLIKPGGILIITAPFCSLTHYSPFFYQTGYSKYFYEHWLNQLGCSIKEKDFNGNYFEYLAQELHRLPSISKKYAGIQINGIDKIFLNNVLRILGRLTKHDRGSNEFLCYGLHILACKE